MNARKNGEKNDWFFYQNVESRHDVKRRAQLKWGTIDGPVHAELWIGGKGMQTKTFERSEDGLKQAVETIRGHLR